MHKTVFAVAAVLVASVFAAGAAAAGKGATVVDDQGCSPFVFGTVCIVTKTTTNTTTTPSGNLSYAMNGTIERTMTFVFGGTYTVSTEIHDHSLLKNGEFAESGTHYTEAWESISGTYHLSCLEAWSTHWAGDRSQPGNFVLECTVL